MIKFVLLLCIANILFPVFIVVRKCIDRGFVEFDHILLFSGAFIYYWIVPFLSYFVLQAWPQLIDATLAEWLHIFDNVNIKYIVAYLIISFSFYTSFVLGCLFGDSRINALDKRNIPIKGNADSLLKLLLPPILCLFCYFLFKYRDSFFKGYNSELSLADDKGEFVAFSLIILVIAFVREEINRYKGKVYVNLLSLNSMFRLYLVVAILILSLGGRLYFISSVVMLVSYITYIKGRFRLKTLLVGTLASLFIMGVIGSLRTGDRAGGGLNMTENIQHSMLESLLSSLSLFGFLIGERFEFLNFPLYLISDFFNLIPTALYPNKKEFYMDPRDDGYFIYNPIGGLHTFISFMTNFGSIGSCLIIFCIGWYLSYLKGSRAKSLNLILYAMVCGWLPFTFFRDPFIVSIVKNIFEFTFLAVLLIGFISAIGVKKYFTPSNGK
jgi:hypothetical protein